MKIKVLGSSGAEFPGMNPPGFLVDENLLLDAGTIGSALNEQQQMALDYILLTHAHLDHIRGIPFLADNIILQSGDNKTVRVMSIPEVLGALKNNLLNDLVWPDFTQIPSPGHPILTLEDIAVGEPFRINDYSITAFSVTHSVPAVGFLVESSSGGRLVYTGDTGPTDAIWAAMDTKVDILIVEVSMPNKMHEMAIKTGHLTADLLAGEVRKMKKEPDQVLITHPKPQYLGLIKDEIAMIGVKNIRLLKDGEELTI